MEKWRMKCKFYRLNHDCYGKLDNKTLCYFWKFTSIQILKIELCSLLGDSDITLFWQENYYFTKQNKNKKDECSKRVAQNFQIRTQPLGHYRLFFTKRGVLYNKQKSIGDQVTKLQSDFLKSSNHHPTKPGGPKDL